MNDKNLVMAAAQLARQAPEGWSKFRSALADYTEDKMVECLQSSIEMLPVTQGRAQAMAQLTRLLNDCIKIAETIDKKRP